MHTFTIKKIIIIYNYKNQAKLLRLKKIFVLAQSTHREVWL